MYKLNVFEIYPMVNSSRLLYLPGPVFRETGLMAYCTSLG